MISETSKSVYYAVSAIVVCAAWDTLLAAHGAWSSVMSWPPLQYNCFNCEVATPISSSTARIIMTVAYHKCYCTSCQPRWDKLANLI
jgi:hypothetical protein